MTMRMVRYVSVLGLALTACHVASDLPGKPDPEPSSTDTGCAPLHDYADLDGDGYGDPATGVLRCERPAGRVGNSLDCDDAEPLAWTDAVEVACDGVDNDCDGVFAYCERSFLNATAVLAGPDADRGVGASVAAFVGDVDGDGLADAVLGADDADLEDPNEVYLLHGPSLTLSGPIVPDAVLVEEPGEYRLGARGAGDVDGDGLDDFWVAWPYRLVLGSDLSAMVDLTSVATSLLVPYYDTRFTASAADATGDGVADLLLSNDDEFLLFRGPYPVGTFDGSHPTLTIAAHADDQPVGTADVADFDGDGAAELLVGLDGWPEFGWCGDVVNIGTVPGDLTGSIDMIDTAPYTSWIRAPWWIRAVPAGDVNGDGYQDLVAAQQLDWFVFAGPLAGELTTDDAVLQFDTELPNDNKLLLAPGDLDRDGLDDLVAFHNGTVDLHDIHDTKANGAMYVVRGGRSGVVDTTTSDALWYGTTFDSSAETIASAGDANGDGVNDVLLAVPQFGADGRNRPDVVYYFDGTWLLEERP